MRILHIAAHLGGGVGKAHAALCAETSSGIDRHYVLLEEPRDRRFADLVLASGARITIAPTAADLAAFAGEADLVQIEWWNHPKLYQALCDTDFPPMRSLVWCHISGLFTPLVPSGLFTAVGRVAFTSDCSFENPDVLALPAESRARLTSVNSGFGFGFDTVPVAPAVERFTRRILTLGTLDFAKMSRETFDVIDAVETDIEVALWGSHDFHGEVARAAAAMRRPERVVFRGHTADPAAVLSQGGIFLYLLQPDHYGTGENGLVEAMSLGLVPLAFDNPAERCIIDHGVSGFLEPDAASAARRLEAMLADPVALAHIGRNAMTAAARRTPAASAERFASLHTGLMGEEKQPVRFRDVLGETGAHWFLSTQVRNVPAQGGVSDRLRCFPLDGAEAKGSLAHFRAALPDDPSL